MTSLRGLAWLFAGALALASIGCGGGGGGSVGPPPDQIDVLGQVTWVGDGQAPLPAATVQIDQATTQTSTTDGRFTLKAPASATSLVVLYQNGPTSVSFRFTIPAAVNRVANLGEIFIGPEKVAVAGRVVSAIDANAVQGATVQFAGRQGSTDASGNFRIDEVAYSNEAGTFFFDIEGQVTRAGFFPQTFRAMDPASAGVVQIGDILLAPESGNTPPPPPYNITGTIAPQASAQGTVVSLKVAGTVIRRFTAGSDGIYGFWVLPGTYTLSFLNPNNNLSAPDETVTLTSQNQVITRNVTLR